MSDALRQWICCEHLPALWECPHSILDIMGLGGQKLGPLGCCVTMCLLVFVYKDEPADWAYAGCMHVDYMLVTVCSQEKWMEEKME